MKRYVEVYWTPWFVHLDNKTVDHSLNLLFQDPEPLVTWAHRLKKHAAYLKCPSVLDSMKNCFVITSPFDLKITVNRQTNQVTTDRFGQNFFDAYIMPRPHQSAPDGTFLLTLPPHLMFYSDESLVMQVSDLPIITSQSTKNVKLIVGQFDIGQWTRPVEWAVELVEGDEILMRKGDPLFIVRFNTLNNVPVKLVRVDVTDALKQKIVACAGVKKYIKNLKLHQLYALAKSYLQMGKDK